MAILTLLGAPALADEAKRGAEAPETPILIVDRRADSVSLFFSLPATDLKLLFGKGAEGLLDAEGTVDIDGLYEGTFDLADEIFAPMTARLDGQIADFEALSMMVHDPNVLPGFETPWDGETAIAVCTSPETVDLMGLETLQAYLGYYAWQVNPLAALTLEFPDVTVVPTTIEVREFWNMQPIGTRQVTLAGDRTLVLEAGQGTGLGAVTLWLVAAALFGIGVLLTVLHRQGRKPAAEDTAQTGPR